jgi:hypothetical protein
MWRNVVRLVVTKISEWSSVSDFGTDFRYRKAQHKCEIGDSCYELLGIVKSYVSECNVEEMCENVEKAS